MKSRKVKKTARAKAFVSKMKGQQKLASDSDDDSFEGETFEDDQSSDAELKDYHLEQSSEEEVLPLTDDDDSDSEEDIEQGLPNREAWGKKKSVYFNTDFVDQDRGRTYREEDAEKARAELEEALAIQRSVSKFSNVCLTEELQLEMVEKSEKPVKEDEADLDALTTEQKLKLLKKKCPEVLIYRKELLEKMNELKNRMIPLVKYAKEGKIISSDWVDYINHRYELLTFYCLNMSYYFVLKSKGDVPSNHPIFQRVNEFKEYLAKAESVSETINEDLDLILHEVKEKGVVDLETRKKRESNKGESLSNTEGSLSKRNQLNEKKPSHYDFGSSDDEDMDMGEDVQREEFGVAEDVNFNTGEEKRTITYQIAKNKGLAPHRKKECRNPRVHHRMKFKRAQIRRKGQVRNVIKEIKRYDGEPTGISTHVVKSIKFK